MIPKVIHYIWLGKGPLPKIAKKCMASWQKFCPDYKIKRWDESNLNLDLNGYTREAYENKKFAFASDCLRYDILLREGGIYLDIDVELLKPLDEFLSNKAFTGFECANSIAPGLIFGAEKGNVDVKNLLDAYKKEKFVVGGKLNLKTICERAVEYYTSLGLVQNSQTQTVGTTTIYATEFFNPTNLSTQKTTITPNTHSIHHYASTWYSPWKKFKKFVKKALNVVTFGLFGKIFLKK